MLEPQHRFPTFVLAAGALVLVISILIGERMGARVLGQATEQASQSLAAIQVTPEPEATPSTGPFGPDWKRNETLSAAADPHFPDPRVPPVPLPTAPPPPPATPTPVPTPTLNPNIPIWRQQPLPTATPVPSEPAESPAASPEPSSQSSDSATPSPP